MPSTDVNSLNQFRINANVLREGIPVEKGVVLDDNFVDRNEELIEFYCQHFVLYPDLFLDLIASNEAKIELYYYQRILLRACMRYRYMFGTFTRGTSKSFIAMLSQILSCVFLPNSKRFLVSQYKKASLDIAKQKLEEIFRFWPLLKNELEYMRASNDYIELKFKNGSLFHVLSMTSASRGQRATGGRTNAAFTMSK